MTAPYSLHSATAAQKALQPAPFVEARVPPHVVCLLSEFDNMDQISTSLQIESWKFQFLIRNMSKYQLYQVIFQSKGYVNGCQ